MAPRYTGATGDVPDAERVRVDVAEGEIAPRLALSVLVRDALGAERHPESPSHGIRIARAEDGLRVALADPDGAPLDRDVVVRWPVAATGVGLSVDATRPRTSRLDGRRAFGLLTLVPPGAGGDLDAVPRDLVVLLDTSGSMSGRPLEQAKALVAELVRSLGEQDSLELVSFSSAPRRWKGKPVGATATAKKDALAWIGSLAAGGATEMRDGVLEALRPLREDAQRQVVLVTDGLIGSEEQVIATVLRDLPSASRLHAVAVGDSVNRSLTGPVARAGRGLEVVVGLEESPLAAASALVARTARPLVTGLSVDGSALAGGPPSPLTDLFAEAPVLVPVELSPAGGELLVRGTTASGPFERHLSVPPVAVGNGSPAAAALFARESVEALEMRLAAGGARAAIDSAVEGLGLDFQIATRLTSWVAVSEEPTVDPTAPFRRERMPQSLPHGLSVEGLGLRQPASAAIEFVRAASMATAPAESPEERACARSAKSPGPPRQPPASFDWTVPESAGAPAGVGWTFSASYAWRGGQLVVTVNVESGELEWRAPLKATVIDADGRTTSCKVDRRRTTRAGTVEAGRSFRIVLDWPGATATRVSTLALRVGRRELTIPLAEA